MEKSWYDPMVEAYASKARNFYASCEQTLFPIPYTEETFVGVVTTGYQMLKAGEFPTIKRVREELTNYNLATGLKVRKNQVALIFRGKEMGRGPAWQWTNYCWDYIHRKKPGCWLDYNREVNNSEIRYKARADKKLGALQEDFVCLLLTIEYL